MFVINCFCSLLPFFLLFFFFFLGGVVTFAFMLKKNVPCYCNLLTLFHANTKHNSSHLAILFDWVSKLKPYALGSPQTCVNSSLLISHLFPMCGILWSELSASSSNLDEPWLSRCEAELRFRVIQYLIHQVTTSSLHHRTWQFLEVCSSILMHKLVEHGRQTCISANFSTSPNNIMSTCHSLMHV